MKAFNTILSIHVITASQQCIVPSAATLNSRAQTQRKHLQRTEIARRLCKQPRQKLADARLSQGRFKKYS